jgi:type II secretory pathway pseudopilin PulG
MKNLRVVLVVASLLSAGAVLRAQGSDPQTQYAQAVKAYVDAATDELRALRANVDTQVASITNDADKRRFDAVFSKLDACDKLLGELKKSGPRDFDRIKRDFESTRGEAAKAIEDAKKV